MITRWGLFLCGLLYVLGAVFFTPMLISGGFVNDIKMMGLLVPLIMMAYIKLRNYRFIFHFGVASIQAFSIPAPLLDALGGTQVLWLLLSSFYCIADIAMEKHKLLLRKWWPYTAMFLVTMFITIRFLWEPPGSARLSEEGGLGRALYTLLSGWFFFVTYWVTVQTPEHLFPRIYKWVVGLTVWSLLDTLVHSLMSGGFYTGFLYEYRMWMLLGILMPLALYRKQQRWFYVLTLIGVVCGVFAPHRVRLLMALLTPFVMAWIFGRLRRTLIWFVPILLITMAVFGIFVSRQVVVTPVITRTMSLFMQVNKIEQGTGDYSGEIGWSSEFRQTLFANAMHEIMKNPLCGKGFRFNRERLIDSLLAQDLYGFLGVTRSYHNIFLELADNCGLPCSLLFLLLFIAIFIRALKWARQRIHDRYKFLTASAIAYIIPQTFHAFMNGGSVDLMYLCIFMGILTAFMDLAPKVQTVPSQEVAVALKAGMPFRANPQIALRGS